MIIIFNKIFNIYRIIFIVLPFLFSELIMCYKKELGLMFPSNEKLCKLSGNLII